ncbi:hypothetical protein JKI95_05640 [Corynebacterium aquatimens]|uniref:hypothetical protein n=1 Tax=Corynebacterium TaxID=1716 RepID=UPI001F2D6201|nr:MULTISPECIES: hypothetical protein [Corynebacterium]QYH20349.1 hypothetical protein JKI95_05640 [Corynebacterium aquatimens]UIZ92359.1 hypothetical protein JZY91_00625 [Corynebacterium sp. CNCTC7651]
MASQHAVADIQSESFPEYQTAIHHTYIEGYDPVSLAAPHSSLSRYSTWVAMGCILASLFGLGILVWGIGAKFVGWGAQSEDLSNILMILGGAEMVITLLAGFILITMGRKDYKRYRSTTGRVN